MLRGSLNDKMDSAEDLLDPDLIAVVLAEAEQSIEQAITLLNAEQRTPEMAGELFRIYHAVKGNCKMARRHDLASTAQRIEVELDKVRAEGRALNTDEVGLFLELSDLLVLLFAAADKSVMDPIELRLKSLELAVGGAGDFSPLSSQRIPTSTRIVPSRGFNSAEGALGAIITLESSPRLFQLMQRAEGEDIRRELLKLVQVFMPERAPREKVCVVAKMQRLIAGVIVEDSVVVRDISVSGALLVVSAQMGLMAQDLTQMHLRLCSLGQVDFEVEAQLARVVQVDQEYIVIGVQFVNVPAELATAIHQIEHVHSKRTPSSMGFSLVATSAQRIR